MSYLISRSKIKQKNGHPFQFMCSGVSILLFLGHDLGWTTLFTIFLTTRTIEQCPTLAMINVTKCVAVLIMVNLLVTW